MKHVKNMIVLAVAVLLMSTYLPSPLALKDDVQRADLSSDPCYGFIVPLRYEDSVLPSSIQLSISNLVTDLLRMNLTVLWVAENFSCMIRSSANDTSMIRSFEKGAFIIPFSTDERTNALITSIIYDYGYESEIESFEPFRIYFLMEPVSLDVYPLKYPRVAMNIGSMVPLIDLFWYVNILVQGGFLDHHLLLEDEIIENLNNNDFNMIIWPGGIGYFDLNRVLDNSLNPRFCTTVRDFVKNGGGFTGSCYGAETAASGHFFPFKIIQSYSESFPVTLSLGLISDSLFLMRCGCRIKVNFTDMDHPVTFGLERTQRSFHIYGPVFSNRTMDERSQTIGVLSEVEPLWWDARYQDIIELDFEGYLNDRIGKPIWVGSEFGKGKTVVFGDHPEFFIPTRHDRLLQNVFFYITSEGKETMDVINAVEYDLVLTQFASTSDISLPKYQKTFSEVWDLTDTVYDACGKIDTLSTQMFQNIFELSETNRMDKIAYKVYNFYLDQYEFWLQRFIGSMETMERIKSLLDTDQKADVTVDQWERTIVDDLKECIVYCQEVLNRFSTIAQGLERYHGSEEEESSILELFEDLEPWYKKGYDSLTGLGSSTIGAYRDIWYHYEAEVGWLHPSTESIDLSETFSYHGTRHQSHPMILCVDSYAGYGGNGSIDHPFRSIQDAIDVAKDGDTVFVRSGVYYGRVVVDKSIKLLGENRTQTIIDGENRPHHHVMLTASHIEISNFTIQHSDPVELNCGLICEGSENNIHDNVFRENCIGVGFYPNSKNNTVNNNYFVDNNLMGLAIDEISIQGTKVYGNVFEDNGLYGFYSVNLPITVSDNFFINDSVTIPSFSGPLLIEFSNNTVNGKPLVFLRDSRDIDISDAGQIILFNCSDCTVEGLDISNTDNGILIIRSSNIHLLNCSFSNNSIGMVIRSSENIQVLGSSIQGRNEIGIWLEQSQVNTLSNNHISDATIGIFLDSSNKNTVLSNQIEGNHFGISVSSESSLNKIKQNNLFNNDQNAFDMGKNRWSRNYWDDWKGLSKGVFRWYPYNIPDRSIRNIDLNPSFKPYIID